MAKSRLTAFLASAAFIMSMTACGPSLVITNVDYSQPIESVLTPDNDQVVSDQRFGIQFSIAPILEEEQAGSVDEIRLIRNRNGFYFVTADGFNNVYVFEPANGQLALVRAIEVTEQGLGRPALNQRGDHIEVINRATGETYRVNEDGEI